MCVRESGSICISPDTMTCERGLSSINFLKNEFEKDEVLDFECMHGFDTK